MPRTYSYRLPKKVKRHAFYSALSEKAQSNGLLVLEAVNLETPNTKALVRMLETLGAKGKVLLAMKSPSEIVLKSAHNIPGVRVIPIEGMNTLDICLHDTLILTREALGFLKEGSKR
jgi:large subunit ribosomal protein L4